MLLTQEIIKDIRLRKKAGPNVVIQLDMMKAYDRLSWLFLTKVLRKMGFSERFIGLIFGIVSINWYSVLVNGQPHGFFKSTRGVKQGDPLSPSLFILVAEALSRGLNALHLNLYFCGFGLPKWSPKINHLAYADDTIIFSSSDATSLQLVIEVLYAYEVASG
ncbi:secreted RxLR effector protein 78-like [Nicotiana tabacum]|uniref:Secreted RxLR effector protein 78-like n=1 Tax=Nicotiana tabacum TaxID=4097 RepID=A0AC58UCY3_TOBAC